MGVVKYGGGILPFSGQALRYDRDVSGAFILDLIEDYDIEILTATRNDTNPYSYVLPLAITILDKSDVLVWSEVDKDGNTIRDLPGYDALNPYYWNDDELTVDVFNTYINDSYLRMLFANFATMDSLIVYDSSLTCAQSKVVHQFLQTGGWWIFNRGILSDCGVIKTDGIIWGA